MNNKRNKSDPLLLVVFWALFGVFLFIVSQFLIPSVRDLFRGSELFLVPFAVFFLLGLALISLTIKGKIKGKLKKILILTGLSATGFFVSIFLHNAFYALSTITSRIIGLNYLIEALSTAFFITAIFICPLGFLVGLVGSLILLAKNR
jgi:hypothetical protein